ncbi:Maf-like protein [Parabacteroides sp. ASD2025]|jgi:septum formation protein|uniref:Maf-like protein n=1 Tax=Parabacteroides sp. ASD2025 TaxID=3415987 RepID=UPI0025E818E5|nr:Maf-like protein [uncultured Parabacteroides sp.]
MENILPNLNRYKIVLGSNSPRRRELLAGLDIDFEVQVIPGIDESFPDTLPAFDVPVYIARKKAEAYIPSMPADELLITADTIVWTFGEILGKPKDREDAIAMLRKLSGRVHEVITGVCITTKEKTISFSASSAVSFARLDEEEIVYYVDKYRPFDKAGSYGIQEWIGYVAVEAINGSFYNVMGLPVRLLYQELKKF